MSDTNFPIDKTDEWDSMHDPDSMAQPSPLRYVPSTTTNGTVTPEMSETCHLADIPGHDCAVDPCEPPSVSEMNETKHIYVSTACFHNLHDRCRQNCKFCGTPCSCSCHTTPIDKTDEWESRQDVAKQATSKTKMPDDLLDFYDHARSLAVVPSRVFVEAVERIAALEAELAQAQEELKVCDQIINTIEGLTGHNRARSDMRADGAVAEIVAERDSLRLQLERTRDQRNLLDNKLQGAEADARRLYEALKAVHHCMMRGEEEDWSLVDEKITAALAAHETIDLPANPEAAQC